MAGTSNITGDESITFTDNMSFDGTERGGKMTTDGQLWIGSTAGRHVRLGSLSSSDSSILITNGPGSINLRSNPAVVPDLHVAKWIVNSIPNSGGNQTTIAAAITAASSGDTIFITTGTYTENLTLKAGVNLVAFDSDSDTPNVTIIGKLTATFSGTCSISNIRLQTNADNLLSMTGSNATIINLNNCYLNCTNNTGISNSVANTSSQLNIINCRGNLATTGIVYLSDSSTGALTINYSNLFNSGLSTTNNTKSAGSLLIFSSGIQSPWAFSSSGGGGIDNSVIDTNLLNVTGLTTSGTATISCVQCYFISGSAVSISIGSGTTVSCADVTTNSSNTNPVSGAGTLLYTDLSHIGSGNQINPTTITRRTLDGAQYKGRADNTAPVAGMIGEEIRNYATGVSIASITPTNITSISVTPGIWDISAISQLTFTGNNTLAQIGISATSATIVGNAGDQNIGQTQTSTGGIWAFSIPSWRVNVASTTTYFLVGNATFSTGSLSGAGRISAKRVA